MRDDLNDLDLDLDLDAILAEFSAEEPKRESVKKPSAPPKAAKAAPERKPRHAPQEEPTVLRPAAPKAKPRPEKVKPQPEKPKPQPKKPRILPTERGENTPRHFTRRSLGALGLLLTAIALGWLLLHVHPGSGALSEDLTREENIPARLSLYLDSELSRTLGGVSAQSYALADSAPAPAPDPARYGVTDDVSQVAEVIELAASLLDGQSLAWNPDAQFLPGSSFRYYLDDSIFMLAWKEIIDNKCCTCAEVKIADGSQLRRKLAEDAYGSGVQLYASQMAREANAVVAINGDFYAFRNIGITVYRGQLYRCEPRSVDTCFFTDEGDMVFAYAGQLQGEDAVRKFIEDNNIRFSVAFGPVLVDDGKLRTVSSYPVGEIDHYYSRSSIGMLDSLHYLLMTVNYEGDYQHTCTTMQSGQYMLEKGCRKAYSLDGGQTSVIVIDGVPFNRVDWNNERIMSDIIYFSTAVHREEVGS